MTLLFAGALLSGAAAAQTHAPQQVPPAASRPADPSTPARTAAPTPQTTPTTAPATVPAGTYNITIRATGEANPAAHGREVWVLRFTGVEERPAATLLKPAEGWFARDGAMVATGASSVMAFKGQLSRVDSIVFLRHPWSGKVEVSVNGAPQTLDLYSPESASAMVKLSGEPTILAPVAATPPASTTESAKTTSVEVTPAQAPAPASPLRYVWIAAGAIVVLFAVVVRMRRKAA